MAKTHQAPRSVRVANVLITTLLRAGLPLVGQGLVIGNYPLYLLTVRGRKSGLPRTVPLVILELNGKRYVGSPYGIVDWVRNLRAAGEATLTRGRRSETVNSRNCPQARRPSFCEKTSKAVTLSLATLASLRTRHLRSLSVRRSAIRCLCWKANSAVGQPFSVCDTDEQTRVKIQFHQNSMATSIDPEKLMAARKAGATLAELHWRVYAGEFLPARPMDLHMLL
jgi:deazaflavin-dependent oxidoreductase (nitroreductase family)